MYGHFLAGGYQRPVPHRVIKPTVTQNEFFLNPSIVKLSTRIIELKAYSTEFPKLVPLSDSNDDGKWFPASGSQEQMIALWETSPTRYNMGTTIEFTKEPLNVEMLKQAFTFVVQQQPTLRTVVSIEHGNKFVQKVLPVEEAASCYELKVKLCYARDENDVRSIIKEENQYVFPLYDVPIVRGVVIKVADGSDFLFLSQYRESKSEMF